MDSVNLNKAEKSNILLEDMLPLKVINESSLSMITYISLKYHFLKIPHALHQLLGYTENELLSLGMEEIIYPDDFKKFKSLSAGLQNREMPTFDIECRCYSRYAGTRRRTRYSLWDG